MDAFGISLTNYKQKLWIQLPKLLFGTILRKIYRQAINLQSFTSSGLLSRWLNRLELTMRLLKCTLRWGIYFTPFKFSGYINKVILYVSNTNHSKKKNFDFMVQNIYALIFLQLQSCFNFFSFLMRHCKIYI